MQTEWTEEELLASHPTTEPLVAGDVRCHGGFDADGNYVSPRTKNRWPAIDAWKEQRAEQFGTELLDIPLDRWPENYPNVPQAKFLLSEGVREPVISTLTRIGTVEGFGSMIRYSVIPDLQERFDEDVRGTAMWHLDKGLYEAHARDESGFEAEGGHKQMWFAARDIAFENPVTEDETAVMLERMGIAGPGGKVDVQKMIADAMARRVLPDDIPFELESLIERMARLLLIEISAYHTFAWAEDVLSDPDLTAGEDSDREQVVSMGVKMSEVTIAKNDGIQAYPTIVALAESPKQAGVLYAGTDDGRLQVTVDGGKAWTDVFTKLPDAPRGAYISRVTPSKFEAGTAYATRSLMKGGDEATVTVVQP